MQQQQQLSSSGRAFDPTPNSQNAAPPPQFAPQQQYPQQPYPVQGQQQQYPYQVIMQAAPYNEGLCGRRLESYKAKQSFALGITQIIIGVFCIILNSVGIIVSQNSDNHPCCYYEFAFSVGYGMWPSILFIIAGGFGIGARSKNPCPVIAFMIMSIIAAVFTMFVIGFSAGGLAHVSAIQVSSRQYGYPWDYEFQRDKLIVQKRSKLAMHALLLILGMVEAMVAIWSSIICCAAACCCRDNRGTVNGPGTVQYGGQSGQQQVYIHTQGQQQSFNAQPAQQYAGGSAYPDAEASAPSMPPSYSAASAPSMPPAYSAASAPPAYIGPPREEKSGVPSVI